MFLKTFNVMGWEAAILEGLGKWLSSPGSVWVVETPRWPGWQSQVPLGMMMPLPGGSWAQGCAWCFSAQRGPAPWPWVFNSCFCFHCSENWNNLVLPQTLPCGAVLEPKITFLTSMWTVLPMHKVHLAINPVGVVSYTWVICLPRGAQCAGTPEESREGWGVWGKSVLLDFATAAIWQSLFQWSGTRG